MARIKTINPNRNLRAYIVGLAIGDGNLSNPNGRATRLRITCDTKYPYLIQKIVASLKQLFPENKIGIVSRKKTYLDISVYSNHLEKLLGWHSNGGSKIRQQVTVPGWIYKRKSFIIQFLTGLFETDGCTYEDRGYRMVSLTTSIRRLAYDTQNLCTQLGFVARLYRVKNKYSEYHLRISKNTNDFIKLLNLNKA